jgi:phage terminase large subunit-like protein
MARKPGGRSGGRKGAPPGIGPPPPPEVEYRRSKPSRGQAQKRRKSRAKSSALAVADSYAAEAVAGNVSQRVKAMASRYLDERRHGSGVVWDGERLDELVEWGRANLSGIFGPMEWDPWAVWAMAMFVARRGEDGLPLTRDLVLQVPRGCGKTQIAAALAGWSLERACLEDKKGVEIVILATLRDKAVDVIRRLEGIPNCKSKAWKVMGINGARPATLEASAGAIKAASSTPQNADGISPSLVILDEASRMDETFNRARSSTMKVPWSQTLVITTPDVDQYHTPYGAMLRTIEEALDNGKPLPLGTLAVMHQADAEDDPSNPLTWAKANPALGIRIQPAEYERRLCELNDPKQREEFYTQCLSTFTNDLSAAIPIQYFDECVDDWDLESVRGLPAMIGIDFSIGGYSGAQCDLTSLNLAVWDGVKLRSRNWHWWAGRSMADDETRTRMPLRKWEAEGFVRKSGEVINLDDVRDVVAMVARTVDLKFIVCDPAAGQAGRVQRWESEYGWPVSRAPRSAVYMGSAWAIWQEFVRGRRIAFHTDPVLRGAIESSKTETGPTGLVTVRKSTERSNNDPLIACIVAIKAMNDREMLSQSMYGADASRIAF